MAVNSGERGTARRKRVRNPKFHFSWLEEDIFKVWLAPSPLKNKAHCTACDKVVQCGRNMLIRHSKSAKHIRNIRLLDNKASCNNNNNNTSSNSTTLSHIDKVKLAEIRLSAFFAEHNVAFQTADHLIPLIQDICRDPEILQDLTLARDKSKKRLSE